MKCGCEKPVRPLIDSAESQFILVGQHENLPVSAKTDMLAATVTTWNDFGDKVGSFADEHSTL